MTKDKTPWSETPAGQMWEDEGPPEDPEARDAVLRAEDEVPFPPCGQCGKEGMVVINDRAACADHVSDVMDQAFGAVRAARREVGL